ncbi:hypothetical protein [Haliangium ochraceum]|uniref:Uncharacterized protein n=1 Tax=Haliangium ochraceum (strain DSM 14365 / JCM 11303 / SMP-2) TaxID=502025 RepID=D0LP60_HALO1|nr:hypothetical protein [Haliangium ochraceum]ACY13425.1 hypothetical protein Hoch_0809 [Haliangium ochraceum DSM 14365]
MSMNDLVNDWENAVDSLEQDESEELTAEQASDSAENLFEAARW